jgi:signal transduction histidine kinase
MATGTISAAAAKWSRDSVDRASVLRAVAFAGIVATGVTVWTAAISPIYVDPAGQAFWRGAAVGAYWAVGVYTWRRRPDSRLGPLITALAFAYAAMSLTGSGVPLVYTIGQVIWVAAIVFTAYVYLGYPRGRLESGLERWFVSAYAATTAAVWVLILALSPKLPPGGSLQDCGTRCPHNALQIFTASGLTGNELITAFHIVFTIALIGIAMLIFNKAWSSSSRRRRAIMPLAIVFIASIAEFVIALFVSPGYPDTRGTLRVADGLLTLAVPLAIFAGQLRGQVFAAMRLSRIAVSAGGQALTPAAVQSAIGDALGDSTLQLGLWSADRAAYVDVHGQPLKLPSRSSEHGITYVTNDDRPVAALIHDPLLETDSGLGEAVAATSLMLFENARLVEELRASRSRLVETAERERRRVEQDLHDGAQQRLIAIQIRVQMAREQAGGQQLARELDGIQREAVAALDELRALARGIYPPTLHDSGPAVALRSFALSAPIAVEVTDRGVGRLPDAIEAAIYYCAQEAIQNAVKHAGPGSHVSVSLARRMNSVELVIDDDGVGMPSEAPAAGFGLGSMRDRIEAVAGEFEIVSSPGRGTSVRATIPMPDSER